MSVKEMKTYAGADYGLNGLVVAIMKVKLKNAKKQKTTFKERIERF